MNERGNTTNNEDNNILDDNNIENFLTTTVDANMPLYDDYDVGKNSRHINDDNFCLILSIKLLLQMLVN